MKHQDKKSRKISFILKHNIIHYQNKLFQLETYSFSLEYLGPCVSLLTVTLSAVGGVIQAWPRTPHPTTPVTSIQMCYALLVLVVWGANVMCYNPVKLGCMKWEEIPASLNCCSHVWQIWVIIIPQLHIKDDQTGSSQRNLCRGI